MATHGARSAVASGERAVAVAAPTSNTVIITGDRNTVEMRLEGVGALLAFAFRWNRPRRRRRRHRLHGCPPRFERHIDREQEATALLGEGGPPRVVNLYGEPGIGKTYVLVDVLNRRQRRPRHGSVYLDGSGQAADDLLHAVFDEFFECRVQRRDLRIERYLRSRRAIIALEDVELEPDGGQRLVLGAPRSRFLVTSRGRVLFDGTPLQLTGVAPEHAVGIAEQELGRSLTEDERRAAEQIATALDGHPLRLRQSFGRARDEARPLDVLAAELSRPPKAGERLAAMTPAERAVARALAVHGTASLGLEHLAAVTDVADARAAAETLERRHDAGSRSPRYSLTGVVAETLPLAADLSTETERALEHFTEWVASVRGEPGPVLREGRALLALLERAQADERFPAVVQLGRAVEGAFAWGRRWQEWGRILELVLAAARGAADPEAEAWALHQRGTRAYGLGQASEARSWLLQALELRERLGDQAGVAATRHNLRIVSGPPPLLYRLSHLSLGVVAVIVTLLIGGGVAGAGVFGGDGGSPRLTLALEGDGGGSVVSSPSGVRCAPECEASFEVGTEVTLRPRPAVGSEFTGWRGGGCQGTAACRLRLAGDANVFAEFVAIERPVDLAVRVRGEGTVASRPAGIRCPGRCTAMFERGRRVELTAAARPGSSFAGWSRDCKGRQRCELTLERGRQVTARFTPERSTATLTVDKRGDGEGRVTSRPSAIDCGTVCSSSMQRGSQLRLIAAAAKGSVFEGWSGGACAGIVACELTLARDERVIARFAPEAPDPGTFILTAERAGKGGGRVISRPPGISCGETCEAEFPEQSEVVLRAVADDRSDFAGWSGGGCSGIGACTVTMDAARSVTATFSPEPTPTFTLTTTVTGNGTIEPDCSQGCAYAEGETVHLTAVPADQNTSFARWTGCEPNPADRRQCDVTLSEDREVTALFRTVD